MGRETSRPHRHTYHTHNQHNDGGHRPQTQHTQAIAHTYYRAESEATDALQHRPYLPAPLPTLIARTV